MILALHGHDAPTIAQLLSRWRRAVQQWIKWYSAEGVEAIADVPRPGEPKKLSPAQEQALARWLDEGPPPEAPVSAYRGPQAKAHLEEAFGVAMSLSGTYELLHRLSYAPLRPRPRHRKADAPAQEAFNVSAPFCGHTPQRTPRTDHRGLAPE